MGGDEAAARDDFADDVRRARTVRSPRPQPTGSPGWATVSIHLPLVVTRGGIEQLVGVLSLAREGDAEPTRTSGRRFGALAALDRGGDRPGAARLDGRRAVRVVRADGPHGPADRPRQRADVRADPRARAGPRRTPGRRGLAGGLRRRRPDRDERGRRATRPATTSCGPWPPSSPSRSDSSTRSPGSVATSSCSSRRAPPERPSPSASSTGSRPCPPRSGRPISVSAGVARFPVDGGTAEDLRAAADAALDGPMRPAAGGSELRPPPATEG